MKKQQVNCPERVRTAEAARITGLHARTLQEKAAAGLIPGAKKVFGRWTRAAKGPEHFESPQRQYKTFGQPPSGKVKGRCRPDTEMARH